MSPLESLSRELLADVAHSLRTPLSAIKGYSSTLLQSDVTWPVELHREFLETIDRETDRLSRVVTELLTPVTDDAGFPRLNLVTATIQSLFDKAESELAAEDWQRPVEFLRQAEIPLASVDPRRMVQVITYLVHCVAETVFPVELLRVEACWRDGQPVIVIGAANQATAGNDGGRMLGPYGQKNEGTVDGLMEHDLRVVISRSLLDAHGVALHAGSREAPAGMFWFPVPTSAASDHEVQTRPRLAS